MKRPECGIDGRANEIEVRFAGTAAQPRKCRVDITKPAVNHSEQVRRNVSDAGFMLERLQMLARLRLVAEHRKSLGQTGMADRVLRLPVAGAVVIAERLLWAASSEMPRTHQR